MGKKIYFLSDFHLGAPNQTESFKREKILVDFLKSIINDCEELYLVGDLFDFWFEYKHVIPKHFTRFLGILAAFADSGIPIHIFTGNHDLWMKDYLTQELNAKIYHHPIKISYSGKQFYIGHGDGLGPGDAGYKFIKKIFTNPACKWLFRWIHPDLGIGLADWLSKSSRAKTGKKDAIFLGNDKEWLVQYCNEFIKSEQVDFFIFGHRHLPLDIPLNNAKSRYINLGDWIYYFSYATFDGQALQLKYLNKP